MHIGKSMSKFFFCYLLYKYLLSKLDTEVVVLDSLYFQWCILNDDKIGINVLFSKVVYQFLLVSFRNYMTKISD